MAEADGQEKTEQPSGKRVSESRSKGQVAKSIEINSVAVFSTGLFLIIMTQKHLSHNLSALSHKVFSELDKFRLTTDMVSYYAYEGMSFYIVTLGPIFAGLVIISLAANYGQVGFHFTPKAMAPRLAKFNPISNFKNMFLSSRSLLELGKSLLKLAIISSFTYWVLESIITQAVGLVDYSVEEIVKFMVSAAYELLWKITIAYVVIAAADFIYQKRKHTKDLMMTKQEVKEEAKSDEGDPHVKGKIRSIQRAAARRRMMKDIPTADVVITNPTHFAIALKYSMGNEAAPKVVAKGVDELAQKIKKVAVENGVPLHEDRELARALYKACDIGDEIPASLFKAVAQILAYVFKLKNNTGAKKSIV